MRCYNCSEKLLSKDQNCPSCNAKIYKVLPSRFEDSKNPLFLFLHKFRNILIPLSFVLAALCFLLPVVQISTLQWNLSGNIFTAVKMFNQLILNFGAYTAELFTETAQNIDLPQQVRSLVAVGELACASLFISFAVLILTIIGSVINKNSKFVFITGIVSAAFLAFSSIVFLNSGQAAKDALEYAGLSVAAGSFSLSLSWGVLTAFILLAAALAYMMLFKVKVLRFTPDPIGFKAARILYVLTAAVVAFLNILAGIGILIGADGQLISEPVILFLGVLTGCLISSMLVITKRYGLSILFSFAGSMLIIYIGYSLSQFKYAQPIPPEKFMQNHAISFILPVAAAIIWGASKLWERHTMKVSFAKTEKDKDGKVESILD